MLGKQCNKLKALLIKIRFSMSNTLKDEPSQAGILLSSKAHRSLIKQAILVNTAHFPTGPPPHMNPHYPLSQLS